MLYPALDLRSDELQSFCEAAAEHLVDQSPFQCELAQAGHFSRKNDSVVWLGPTDKRPFEALYNSLARLVPQCASRKAFTAHLTLGEWAKAQGATEAEELNQHWQPIHWEVDHVLLLTRDPDPFRVRAIIPLGGGEPIVAPSGGSLCDMVWGAQYEQLIRSVPGGLLEDPAAAPRCEGAPSARGFSLGPNHSFVAVTAPSAAGGLPVARRAIHFCLDNSISMGNHSKAAKDSFAKLVPLANEPCSLVCFDRRSHVLSENIMEARDMLALTLPPQRNTNISAGVHDMVRCAIRQEARGPGEVHHLMVLLTDGAHNDGSPPEAEIPRIAAELREKAPTIRCSVVVIGISGASKTNLGILAKTSLESVPIPSMLPIYFCQESREMQATLDAVGDSLTQFGGSSLLSVRSTTGLFVQDVGRKPVRQVDVCVADGSEAGLLMEGQLPDSLLVDGQKVPVKEGPFNASDTMAAIEILMQRLRQNKVAAGRAGEGAIYSQIKALEPYIAILEQCMAREAKGDHAEKATGAKMRMRRYRQARGAVHGAQRLRNELTEIASFNANDSASQASFCCGGTMKFAGKALARAAKREGGAVVADPSQRLAGFRGDMLSIAAKMGLELRKDTLLRLANAPDESLAAVKLGPDGAGRLNMAHVKRLRSMDPAQAEASAELRELLDMMLPEALDALQPPAESWLSLLSQRQQLEEWSEEVSEEWSPENEYEALTYVGMLGVPLQVVRCAAAQMDPYQLQVERVWPSQVDSASLLCALQCGDQVNTPEGGLLQDILPLIDPACPNASRLAARSKLIDTLYSVVCCRDLHMYIGEEQRFALHAHALQSVLSEPVNTSTISLAMRIVYSVRAQLGARVEKAEGRYYDVLRQLVDWEPLTEAAGVDHPLQALLAMSALDCKTLGLSAPGIPALYNLCNETLSREMRLRLKACTDGSSGGMMKAAQAQMCEFLGVSEESCPQPTSVEDLEPPRESVWEECVDARPAYCVNEEKLDARELVEKTLYPTMRMVQFAQGVQAYAGRQGGLAAAMKELEQGGKYLVQEMVATMSVQPTVSEVLEMGCHEKRIMVTMVAQAYLCHSSGLRTELPDVQDADTIGMMAAKLRMAVYEEALALKMSEWQKIAGSLILQKAAATDSYEFNAMLASRGHAHGYNKDEFWALARHAKRAKDKTRAFVSHCNQPFAGGKGWLKL